MNWKEILDIVWLTLACIVFILMIVYWIKDLRKSDKYWEEMNAQLELFKTTLKKENDLLKKVQAYGEWLDTYHALMHTNVKLEDSEFNNGTLTAAADIEDKFLELMGEYVDSEKNSD